MKKLIPLAVIGAALLVGNAEAGTQILWRSSTTGAIAAPATTEPPPIVSSDGKRIGKPLDGQTPASCARMNELAGFDAVCPPCDSETGKAAPICQQPH